MDFGARLAEVRKSQGLSQSQLADLVETSQSAISQIEVGDRNPSFEMIRELAQALKVSPAYLLGAEAEGLLPEEQAHFREYRGLTDQAKDELATFMGYLKAKKKQAGAQKKK